MSWITSMLDTILITQSNSYTLYAYAVRIWSPDIVFHFKQILWYFAVQILFPEVRRSFSFKAFKLTLNGTLLWRKTYQKMLNKEHIYLSKINILFKRGSPVEISVEQYFYVLYNTRLKC